MGKVKLHWWIMLGMAVGVVTGTLINQAYIEEAREAVLGSGYAEATPQQLQENAQNINEELRRRVIATPVGAAIEGVSRVFMNLLKMIVLPLVFFSLVLGISGMKEAKRLGRIGIKTGAWYVLTSLFAIITGLVVVNLIGPGRGTGIQIPTQAREAQPPRSFWDVIASMIPENIVEAAATFDMFGVIFFSLLFGIFLLLVEEELAAGMLSFIEGGAAVMMKMTQFIISLAPVGIAALIANTVATSGPSIFISLLPYVLTVALALAIHFLVTLPLLLRFFTGYPPYRYMRAMSPALWTAFSTASSSGTLAVTMERARQGAGVSNRITSFVLPLGATVNMDGTALYECVTVLFIAQVHASTHSDFPALTLGSQLFIVFLALTVSIGAAGIPHAGLVMMVIILQAVHLPLEYTSLIWGVDRILDMARTMTNVWSDATGAAVIAHSENEIEESVLFSPSP